MLPAFSNRLIVGMIFTPLLYHSEGTWSNWKSRYGVSFHGIFIISCYSQRASRERRERHAKDLEAKLSSLEAAQHETASENERLKRDLQKMSLENKMLKETYSINNFHLPGHGRPLVTTGSLQYNSMEFGTMVFYRHPNEAPSHRTSHSGERPFAAGATWDYIKSGDLFKTGLVEIEDNAHRLKHQAKCDGQGQVLGEKTILEAIEENVTSERNELL